MPKQIIFRRSGEGNDMISLSKRQLGEYGFNMDVVESFNAHDDIQISLHSKRYPCNFAGISFYSFV